MMFDELKDLRLKLDQFYQYTDDMSFWKKQNKLHHEYYNLQKALNNLLCQSKLEYFKVICS